MSTTAMASERWHALDAVRGLALLLGVLLHGTLSYLADAAYWIYLVHLPLLMLLQLGASRYAAPVWVEYPLQVGLAMGLLLLSYRWWVRDSWIGAMLNGRRRASLPPADAAAAAQSPAQQPA